jgi:hypothetical protein
MSHLASRRPSPAMVVACLALIVSLGGTAVAAGLLNGSKIKKHSIPGNRLKSNTLTGAQIKESKLAVVPKATHAVTADSATAALKATSADSATKATNADHATAADSATSATSATNATNATNATKTAGLIVFPTQRATEAADQASAPKIPLATVGPFSFYAKCFASDATHTRAAIYIELASGNATFGTEGADSVANLTPATTEDNRELQVTTAATNSIAPNGNDMDFRAASLDSAVTGVVGMALAKNGTPATGNEPFPAGNSCIFGGTVFGS